MKTFLIFICFLIFGHFCFSQDFKYEIDFQTSDSICTMERPTIQLFLKIKNVGDIPFYITKYSRGSLTYHIYIENDTGELFIESTILIHRASLRPPKSAHIKLEKNMSYEIVENINFYRLFSHENSGNKKMNDQFYGNYNLRIVYENPLSRVRKKLKYFETPIIRVRYKEE